MDQLFVIKIGGNIIDDDKELASFLRSFAELAGKKILIHGGGKLATRLGGQLGIPQQIQEGRRITDAESLKLVTMVYAGYVNKHIVSQLQAFKCNAIGLTGADGNTLLAHKRIDPSIDYGYVGDIDMVNAGFLDLQVKSALVPVLSPITHDGKGQLLNTNADTIAREVAKAMTRYYNVTLIYCFEKEGVLLDLDDDASVLTTINSKSYAQLKTGGVISSGMIPKLDNAFVGLQAGISKVVIGKAGKLHQLIKGTSGTTMVND